MGSAERQPEPEAAEPFVTVDVVAKHCSVSQTHIFNMLHRGLPSVKIGGARRFRLSEVDSWLEGSSS